LQGREGERVRERGEIWIGSGRERDIDKHGERVCMFRE